MLADHNVKLKAAILGRYRFQVDFARALGISESDLSKILRGRREPSKDIKQRISRKLRLKVCEIF